MWQHLYDAPVSTLRIAEPSPEDVSVTKEIRKAGQLLSIDVLDHIVLGNGLYVSMKERGLGALWDD